MSKRFPLFLLLFFFLISLNGCYNLQHCGPTPNLYDSWRTQVSTESVDANIRWWEQFQDPVLNSLILEALKHNQDIRVAIANVEDFYARWIVSRSLLFPQVDAQATAFRQELSLDTNPLPAGTSRIFTQYNLLANFAWELDIWGRIKSASKAAFADLVAQEEAQRTVILTVVSAVASSYVQIGLLEKQLEISKNTIKSRKEAARIADRRFEQGVISELPVWQAKAEVDSAVAEMIRIEESIAEQENLLSILVGRAPGDILRGKKMDEWKLPFSIPAGLPCELLQQRPDIIQAEQQLIASDFRIDEARAAFFPDISLTGFFGFESLALSNLIKERSRTWQYGINILQPLLTGGRLIGDLLAREAQSREAFHIYYQTILVALKEVEDALVFHRKSLELVEVLRKREFVLKEYLRLANLQYDNGQVDYLTVLDAERNLFVAQLDLAESEGNTFLSLINIYKALGGGWVVDAELQTIEPCG
jgi:multidrug efflux system outer membrane protein